MAEPTHRTPAVEETLPVDSEPSSRRPTAGTCVALVVLWSTQEPWHAGEIAYLPPDGRAWILGRRDSSPDPGTPPLAFLRARAGAPVPAEPLADPHLSRRQLRFTVHETDMLAVENLGKVALLVNGRATSKATARPGDVLEIDRRLLLLVVGRAWPIPQYSTTLRRFAFGEVDEDGIVGESAAAWDLRRRIQSVAIAAGHVLVIGASGAGKELVARALHGHSPRGARPLVARNAATFPESLVDAELFGNTKNFPNVGMPDRPGLIGAADGSSLFLDEIGELPLHVQPHLLRVLDRGEYQRLGDAGTRRADVRLIGATNRSRSVLRSDLSARFLHEIAVPDLNARREDIPLLVRHIVRRLARSDETRAREILTDGPEGPEPRISTRFMRQVLGVRWETNVRELEALVWRALDQSEGRILGAFQEPPEPKAEAEGASAWAAPEGLPAADAQRIQACLDRHNGVIESAWRELGLSSRYVLRRLIARHGLVLRRHPGRR
jgi:DNA-binding NtrC family response regulator